MSKTPNILVVDDEKDVLAVLIDRVLKILGHPLTP
jgi:hypothetical protein